MWGARQVMCYAYKFPARLTNSGIHSSRFYTVLIVQEILDILYSVQPRLCNKLDYTELNTSLQNLIHITFIHIYVYVRAVSYNNQKCYLHHELFHL